MDEENKVYSITGQVTIGTDEYRDLIEGLIKAKKEIQEEHSKYWTKYSECSRLSTENEKLTASIDELKAFVRSDAEIAGKYADFVVKNALDEK